MQKAGLSRFFVCCGTSGRRKNPYELHEEVESEDGDAESFPSFLCLLGEHPDPLVIDPDEPPVAVLPDAGHPEFIRSSFGVGT